MKIRGKPSPDFGKRAPSSLINREAAQNIGKNEKVV
jgi:hypothetical protein